MYKDILFALCTHATETYSTSVVKLHFFNEVLPVAELREFSFLLYAYGLCNSYMHYYKVFFPSDAVYWIDNVD